MLSLDVIEKFLWQCLIAVIIGVPLTLLTTTKENIPWILIYTFSVLIIMTLFSIFRRLRMFNHHTN